MYAIVETGGKQYKVDKESIINVEKIDKKEGETVLLDKVLLLADKEAKIGTPYVEGCSVECEVVGQVKGEKRIAFKYRRRKSSKTIRGHRQQLTKLKVVKIDV